jgi:hypothetical protein
MDGRRYTSPTALDPTEEPLVLWMVYGIPVFRDGIKACLPAVLATGRLRVSVKKQGKEECLR